MILFIPFCRLSSSLRRKKKTRLVSPSLQYNCYSRRGKESEEGWRWKIRMMMIEEEEEEYSCLRQYLLQHVRVERDRDPTSQTTITEKRRILLFVIFTLFPISLLCSFFSSHSFLVFREFRILSLSKVEVVSGSTGS